MTACGKATTEPRKRTADRGFKDGSAARVGDIRSGSPRVQGRVWKDAIVPKRHWSVTPQPAAWPPPQRRPSCGTSPPAGVVQHHFQYLLCAVDQGVNTLDILLRRPFTLRPAALSSPGPRIQVKTGLVVLWHRFGKHGKYRHADASCCMARSPQLCLQPPWRTR